MRSLQSSVLAINGGSSSIRFAVFEDGETQQRRLDGKIDRIGLHGTTLTVNGTDGVSQAHEELQASDHQTAASFLLDWLQEQPVFRTVQCVGHRLVHGMRHTKPQRITPDLLTELHRITTYAPHHLPHEIAVIEEFHRRHPELLQVACFDTAFHRTMPRVATILPIPRRYAEQGVERYGFHGLSYAYLMEELGRVDPASAKGRVILAHLGNGASLAAVRNGSGIDTSMGFTPASGLMMSTRTGDLDPGVMCYLAQTERMSAEQLQHMVNHESGLRGVSEISSDMRDLLAQETSDTRAAEAVALFCYQAKKWIGSYTAALGGLDTLVFSGGIGENAPPVRARICEGLACLGIELSESRNAKTEAVISTEASPATVRVIQTDEELMIARSVSAILGGREYDEHKIR